jgi:hypothetical protein
MKRKLLGQPIGFLLGRPPSPYPSSSNMTPPSPFSSTIDNARKVMDVINQAGPIIHQLGPIVKNLSPMLQLLQGSSASQESAYKKVGTSSTKKTNPRKNQIRRRNRKRRNQRVRKI